MHLQIRLYSTASQATTQSKHFLIWFKQGITVAAASLATTSTLSAATNKVARIIA